MTEIDPQTNRQSEPQLGPPSSASQRDRRRRKRRFTGRNLGIALLGLVALFFLVSLWFEYSGKGREGYGRLYARRTRTLDLPEREPYSVVSEREVDERDGANPFLVEGMRREQLLGVEPGMLEKQHGLVPDQPDLSGGFAPDGSLGRAPTRRPAEVAITGGPEGVAIEQNSDTPPE